jgi:hypothetical protein
MMKAVDPDAAGGFRLSYKTGKWFVKILEGKDLNHHT